MIDFDKLIETSHAIAVEHGWWDGGERSLDDQFNNFDAEIIEAWEEFRAGRKLDEIYYRTKDGVPWTQEEAKKFGLNTNTMKPEGFTVELADLLIRIADTMGAYGWKMPEGHTPYPLDGLNGVSGFIRRIRQELEYSCADSGDSEFTNSSNLGTVVSAVLSFCEYRNLPLERALEEKTAYNRTRPYRHGGKIA